MNKITRVAGIVAAASLLIPVSLVTSKAITENNIRKDYVAACESYIQPAIDAMEASIPKQERFIDVAEAVLETENTFAAIPLVGEIVSSRGARLRAYDKFEDTYYGGTFFAKCEEPLDVHPFLKGALPGVAEAQELWVEHDTVVDHADRLQDRLNERFS